MSGGVAQSWVLPSQLMPVFQLGYTTLFGWFAAYLFVRTGSVLPPLVPHVFCNVMGIYLPSTALARHPEHKLGASVKHHTLIGADT